MGGCAGERDSGWVGGVCIGLCAGVSVLYASAQCE
jgi:hypothetical protein